MGVMDFLSDFTNVYGLFDRQMYFSTGKYCFIVYAKMAVKIFDRMHCR